MTEVIARVLAKAIRDTLASEVAGLPESRPVVAEAINRFAMGLNTLSLNSSGLLALSELVREGVPVAPPAIAEALESALRLEEIQKTPTGREELAKLLISLSVALMPLKIDVSQLGDAAALLRKGGL